MSKISDLAKTFQQTSQREAENIEQQIQSDLNALTKSIREALQQSEQTINADIRAHQIAMSRAVFKPYLWSLIGLFTAAVVIVVGASIAIWSKRQELLEQASGIERTQARDSRSRESSSHDSGQNQWLENRHLRDSGRQVETVRRDRPTISGIRQQQEYSVAAVTYSKDQIREILDDRNRNNTARHAENLREQSQIDRAANDERLNTLGRAVGKHRAGKHEIDRAVADIEQFGSRASRDSGEARRTTESAERNVAATRQTLTQRQAEAERQAAEQKRQEQRQNRGWSMSR